MRSRTTDALSILADGVRARVGEAVRGRSRALDAARAAGGVAGGILGTVAGPPGIAVGAVAGAGIGADAAKITGLGPDASMGDHFPVWRLTFAATLGGISVAAGAGVVPTVAMAAGGYGAGATNADLSPSTDGSSTDGRVTEPDTGDATDRDAESERRTTGRSPTPERSAAERDDHIVPDSAIERGSEGAGDGGRGATDTTDRDAGRFQ